MFMEAGLRGGGDGTGWDGTTEEWMRKKEWEKGHERRDEEDEQRMKEETHDNKETEWVKSKGWKEAEIQN